MSKSVNRRYGKQLRRQRSGFHYVVIHEFERHELRCDPVSLGNLIAHEDKYLLINQAFAGKQRLMPFFNRANNEDLFLANQAAGVTRGRNGFHKIKANVKPGESDEDLPQHRTDTFDTFV